AQHDAAARVDGASDKRGLDNVWSVLRVLFVPSDAQSASLRGGPMSSDSEQLIVFEDVSKFYGEILGVNRVTLSIEPGITSLVGPNGSGKTTLMNLMTGLIAPTRGRIAVLGLAADHPENFFQKVGYCSQFDSFPAGLTGFEFIRSYLLVHGFSKKDAQDMAWRALHRGDLLEAAHPKVARYSKGLRHRVRPARALAHRPSVIL